MATMILHLYAPCLVRVQQTEPSPSKNPASHCNVMRSITKSPHSPERFLAAKSGQSDSLVLDRVAVRFGRGSLLALRATQTSRQLRGRSSRRRGTQVSHRTSCSPRWEPYARIGCTACRRNRSSRAKSFSIRWRWRWRRSRRCWSRVRCGGRGLDDGIVYEFARRDAAKFSKMSLQITNRSFFRREVSRSPARALRVELALRNGGCFRDRSDVIHGGDS